MLLNRTNLTLSALALSKGLNLGTRSLAANASVNDGDQTLRTRLQSGAQVLAANFTWDRIAARTAEFFQQIRTQ